jgi:hypothetical protein
MPVRFTQESEVSDFRRCSEDGVALKGISRDQSLVRYHDDMMRRKGNACTPYYT